MSASNASEMVFTILLQLGLWKKIKKKFVVSDLKT